ncbi:multisubstrate pseudouridine synthase 7 [Yamadazyma tenuis]|uniref:multisubstrate pseudouridine synthase 7 n=1 Tax=Candida tenuis TaxID=2315449 RepID=UPI0027A48FC6|nr:multisubstrate pseudouridine synthase 7 [Yamadazyma tenuis]
MKTVSEEVKTLKEADVAITQFINTAPNHGFIGLLKQRYSDFLVNEVDLSGNVVHLLDEGIDLGKSKKERQIERRQKERAELQGKSEEEIEQIKEQKKLEADKEPKYELTEENRVNLLNLITEQELKNIEELFSNGGNTETETKFPDKATRTRLHQLLRTSFQGKLDTVTSPENAFRIALEKNSSGPKRYPQESINHVDENGVINYGLGPFKNYLHFTVYKENRETMEVASTIAKFLRLPAKSIRFSGTKDRRGVTCQKFAINKGKVVRVSQLNKGLKNVVFGGFSYEDNNLNLGDLKGNEFLITIRDVKPIDETQDLGQIIDSGFETLKSKGFINYYGMQRFGTFSTSTHTYGVKLLKGDWKGAAELLLAEQDISAPDSKEARRIWAETSNPSLALKMMPSRFTAEHSILKTLASEKLNEDGEYGDQSYFKSIMAIPRNLRIMYVHAYQSYIWNHVASKRMELFGQNVVEGDLVIAENEPVKTEVDENGEVFKEDVAENNFTRARPLTKADIDSGKYSIYDVVLPMPGFDIVYPTNKQLEQVYVEEMGKEGLDPFSMSRRVREFSLSGSYRNLICKPSNVEYKIVKYKEDAEPLVRTDLELLRAKKNGDSLERYINHEEGDKTAIVLKMQLGVSSYATMALREFMKADTSRLGDTLNVKIQ